MRPATGIDESSGRQREALPWRWNLAFNLITVGFCAICALFSLDMRRGAWEQARLSAANLTTAIASDIERTIALDHRSPQAVVDNHRLAYVEDLFGKLDLGPGSTLTLTRRDGTVLARWPLDRAMIGRGLASTQHFGADAQRGTFEARDDDGVKRFVTYRRVGTLPLVFSVGLASDQIDAAWLRGSGILGLVAALLVIAAVTGPDALTGTKLADRICRSVAAMADAPTGGLRDRVTVSIGVACIIPGARAIHQDLLGAADRALFEAKQSGRNRVFSAPPILRGKPRLVA